MNNVIIGPDHGAGQQKEKTLKKITENALVKLKSYRHSTVLVTIFLVVAIPCVVMGGQLAKTVIKLNRVALTTQTPQTTQATNNTKVQGDTTVGGTSSTGTSDSIHSTGATTTGSPPPLGSVYHNVAFVGDSITAGWINDGAHAYPILTFGGLYGHNTGNAWYQLVKGRSGAVAAGALLDLQTFGVQPKNANLMVVEIGTNDEAHMSAATFQTNYQSLISYLMAGSPNAQLVCLGPWRAATDNFGYDATTAYETAIQNVCKSSTNSTAQYVDLSALYANKAYHNTTGDTFHPNNAGAQAIANAIVKAVYP